MSQYIRKVPEVPSNVTGALREWLTIVADQINKQPTFSRFSGTTPNSYLTGQVGDLCLNVGSASTWTRLWVKTGPEQGLSRVSWMAVRIFLA